MSDDPFAVVSSPLRQPAFRTALAIAIVVAVGFGLIVPVLPLFARDFGVGLFAVTFLISAFAGVRLLSNVYTGSLADRVGRRKAIAAGAFIVAGSSVATALAPNYWALLALRGLGGFGSALFFTALLSLVVVMVPASHRGRAVGMLQGTFLLGLVIGPLVGGFLAAPLGLRWPFAIYGACCAAAGVVALRALPTTGALTGGRTQPAGSAGSGRDGEVDGDPGASEPTRPQGAAATWQLTKTLCADRAFLAALIMIAASRWAATGVRFSLVPVFFEEEVGASVLLVSVGLAVAAGTHALLLWPAGTLADKVGRKTLAAPSFFFFAVAVGVLVFADTVPAFLVALAVYGAATGLTSVTPAAVVGDVTPPEQAGVAIGVMRTAGDLGSVLGPLVSGLLADVAGYGWGFGAASAFLVLGGVAAVRMRETLPASDRD